MDTILGKIKIQINNQDVMYKINELINQGMNYKVDKRYELIVDRIDNSESNIIVDCILDCITENVEYGSESGERLELQSYWSDNIKLSIGTEGEIPGVQYEYLKNCLRIRIEQSVPIMTIKYYVAWLTMSNKEVEDIYTWFGADPTL